tara:strand:+ start:472 stop:1827 length:1356 start_codon:yes stop_codon:yes gene_type:complete
MDTINDFINDTIFSDSNESKIGRYGNNAVNLINKFIRLIIAFGMVYLIIIRLPDHGDKDHTMYFNLISIITIFLLLIHIQKDWRGYYIDNFLKPGGVPPECAEDLEPLSDHSLAGDACKNRTIGANAGIFGTVMISALVEQFGSWTNWGALVLAVIALKMADKKAMYALLMFLPIYTIQGIIYYITFASKYSPINFIFGKIGFESEPIIYDSPDHPPGSEVTLKNFSEKFYIMYIVLILLIFFTIIIRLTADTTISCNNFKGAVNLLEGCTGYRIYMVLNALLFIGMSTDFIDSLQKISRDDEIISCPWSMDTNASGSDYRKQLYHFSEAECKLPKDIIKTPDNCNPNNEIIECSEKISHLKGCMMNRLDYGSERDGEGTLKIIRDQQMNGADSKRKRIIIKKDTDGEGYIIDEANGAKGIPLPPGVCKTSIENWLRGYTGTFESLPEVSS